MKRQTLQAEWNRVVKLNTELINAALAYGRFHNKDNFGSPAKMKRSKERLIKAIDAMYEYLEGKKIVKIKPKHQVSVYKTDSKVVYLCNKE